MNAKGLTGRAASPQGCFSSIFCRVPSWTAVDSSGNVYVSDYLNFTIRKVRPSGVVSTLAGQTGVAGTTDGIGSSARFNHPDGVAVDFNGTVFVADRNNNLIRTVEPVQAVQ